jgi:hypothetical protein
MKSGEYLCVRDFFMDTGELSFKQGKTYEFVVKGRDFLCKEDEQGHTTHYMPKEDMENYFDKIEENVSMSEFKVGDKVKRLTASNELVVGGIYTVKEVSVSGRYIGVEEYIAPDGDQYPFDAFNFEFICSAEESAEEQVVQDKCDSLTKEQEIEIVDAWIKKLLWLDLNTPIQTSLWVNDELNDSISHQHIASFVVNSYEAYKAKETEKRKKELIDKKAKLEAELAQINKELEG